MWEYVALFLGAIFSAVMATRSRPLVAALWLALLSALSAVILYLSGAEEVAVIELSVGAGLITVLLAFAISMAEDETMPAPTIPRPFAWILVVTSTGLLIWLILPQLVDTNIAVASPSAIGSAPFYIEVWENRLLDLLVQIVIIISGVIGILGLLGETKESIETYPEVQQ